MVTSHLNVKRQSDWLKMLHEPISLCQVINAVNIINCVNDP